MATISTENKTIGVPLTTATEVRAPFYRNLSWRAIIAGVFAGLAIHLLLTTLGLGLGIGSVEPLTDANPAAKLWIGAAVAWCVSALIALWSGGWVAGRFAPAGYKRSGGLHGFLVWSLAMVAAFLFASSAVGALAGGATKVIGMAAKPVAAAASGTADLAKDAIRQNSDAIGSYVDEAVKSVGDKASPAAAVKARREIGNALAQLFAQGGDINSPESRATVTHALTDAGLSQQDADRLLNEWTASYQHMKDNIASMKAKAEQTAREAAAQSAKAVSHAALWTSLAFVIGAIVASLGGKAGAAGNEIDDARTA